MPLIQDNRPTQASPYLTPEVQRPVPPPSWGDTFSSAFNLENDVVNAVDLMRKPVFKDDPNFDLGARLKEEDLWDFERDDFLGVRSEDEFRYALQKRNQEKRDKEVLSRAGWAGVAAAISAGVISPTMFIPVIGPAARGGQVTKAALEGAGLMALAAGAQEGVLFAAQQTRTPGEAAIGITAATVLGGILGGAAGALRKGDLDRMASDMVDAHGAKTISHTIPMMNDSPRVKTDVKETAPNKWTVRTDEGGELTLNRFDGSDSLHIGTVTVPEKSRGKGLGVALYERAIAVADEMGLSLRSDAFVSNDAKRVWDSLERRGYKITRAPGAKSVDDGWGSDTHWVFEAHSKPAASLSSTVNRSAGAAQVTRTDPGGLKAGPANFLSGIGPVTRGIHQTTSPLVRWMTSQFSDAGLRREGAAAGEIAAEGGTIENNIKTYYRHIQQLKVATDESYNDYIFNGAPPRVGANARGFMAGLRTPGKLSKQQFREEVTRATWANDEHPIPQVAQLAKRIRTEVYDPLFKEAKEVGLYADTKELEEVLGDASYGMRMYNNDYISAHFSRFVGKLQAHIQKKLETEFQERLERVEGQTKRDEELLEDLTRPAEEIATLRAQFQRELNEVNKQVPEHLQAVEDDIGMLRGQKRNIPPSDEGKQARSMIDVELQDLKARGGQPLVELTEKRRVLKRRLRNLNKSLVSLTEKHQKKLAKIERNEELQLNTLNRAVRSAQKFLVEMQGMSEKEWAKATKKVRGRFEEAASSLDKAEAQRARITQREDTTPPLEFEQRLFAQDEVVDKRAAKVVELFNRLDELDSFDRPAWTKLIQEGMNEALEHTRDINARRAVRAARLEEAAKQLDPKIFGDKLKAIKDRIKERTAKIADDYRSRTDDIDLAGRTADFSRYAKETAEDVANKILGTERRIAIHDIIQAERGPELARTLDIPSSEIAEFLHLDSEMVVRTYIRTLAADISIARKFGRADAAEYFKLLTEEKDAAISRLDSAVDKKGEPLSDEKKAKLSQNIDTFYREARHDLHVLLERSKGIRGVPKDPRGWAARAASSLLHLNVLRYMGGVLLASVSDPARIIQKYGLSRTMRQTLNAFTGGLKQVKLSQREAQLAGTALDVVLHSRAHALYDIFDPLRHGTKAEKALEWATTKIGLVALFDPWTAAWKEFAAGLENMTVLEAISRQMEGKATKKDIENLAARNIDEQTAEVIWEQVNAKGGAKVNGVWLPETEAWDITRPEVRKALRTYRSALVGTIDDTIVTPGFERPNWIDSGIAGRMVGQFRSFGLSSTTKVLMSGMQQRDMAYMNGTIISLALGALSYYLWAVATGGEAYKEMTEAGFDKWADEMITRSGQTAVLDEFMRVAQRIPGLSPYVSFSGTRSTRREGGDLTEALLGPSFDALEKASTVIMGADDPTKNILHTLRQLLPWQNLFFLRQAWDMLEAEADLPEKRESRK